MTGRQWHSLHRPKTDRFTGAQGSLRNEPQGMAIDFTDMSMVVKDAVTPINMFDGDPNNKLTYTAPSSKWVRDHMGIYRSGTTFRPEYDIGGAGNLGVSIEQARTNALLRSQEFDNASWTKSNITVTADSVTSPDGTVNADTLAAGAANSYITQNFTRSLNVWGYGSVFLRRKTGAGTVTIDMLKQQTVCSLDANTFKRFELWADLLAATYAVVSNVVTFTLTAHNLKVGDAVRADYQTGTAPDANLTVATVPDANTFTCAQTTGDTSGNVNLYPRNFRITLATSGDEVYAWQAQVDDAGANAFGASSPIPTTSATVTRAIDDIKIATSLFNYDASFNSVYVRSQVVQNTGPSSSSLLAFNDNTANEEVRFALSTTTPQFFVIDGGVTQATINSGSAPAGSSNERNAARWATNDAAHSNDGAAAGTDTSCTMPTVTQLRLGTSGAAASAGLFHIKQVVHVPRLWSNAELASLTVRPSL